MIPLPRVLALHSTADATLASTTALGYAGIQNIHQQHPAVIDIKTFVAAGFLCLRSSNIPAADAIDQFPLDPLSNNTAVPPPLLWNTPSIWRGQCWHKTVYPSCKSFTTTQNHNNNSSCGYNYQPQPHSSTMVVTRWHVDAQSRRCGGGYACSMSALFFWTKCWMFRLSCVYWIKFCSFLMYVINHSLTIVVILDISCSLKSS